jgi:uncharacterized protein (TIGR03437 family)
MKSTYLMLRNIAVVVGLCLPLSAAVTYSYDAAGRLVSVTYSNGSTISYMYDKDGNILSRSVSAASGALINSVTVANGGTNIAQNTWIVIKGANLVPSNTPASGVIWSNAPDFAQGKLPTQLGGVSVMVNGKSAFIYFYCSAVTSIVCTADQINVLTPLDSTLGPVSIVVTSGNTSSPAFTATMTAIAPAFLLFNPAGYTAATHANGSLLGPTNLYPGLSTPAAPNEVIVAYGVGFGLPTTAIVNGSSTQSGPLPTNPVCQIGGNNAAVSFAGLISPGLYQFNLTVPASANNGDNALRCTYNGSTTPSGALITVQ